MLPINYYLTPAYKESADAAQESSLYPGTHAVAALGANGHVVVYGSSSHRRLQGAFSTCAWRHERVYRHETGRSRPGLLGHGSDGSLCVEPDLARRHRAGADRRQVW